MLIDYAANDPERIAHLRDVAADALFDARNALNGALECAAAAGIRVELLPGTRDVAGAPGDGATLRVPCLVPVRLAASPGRLEPNRVPDDPEDLLDDVRAAVHLFNRKVETSWRLGMPVEIEAIGFLLSAGLAQDVGPMHQFEAMPAAPGLRHRAAAQREANLLALISDLADRLEGVPGAEAARSRARFVLDLHGHHRRFSLHLGRSFLRPSHFGVAEVPVENADGPHGPGVAGESISGSSESDAGGVVGT